MKAIKNYDGYIIPQIGFSIYYHSFDSGSAYGSETGYINHRVHIQMINGERSYDFNSEKGALLFISDIVDNFDISSFIEPDNEKYNTKEDGN